MRIVDFSEKHIEAAAEIAKQNYNLERERVPSLPEIVDWPDLGYFAHNGLGVTALDGDSVIGFLCSVEPFSNAFRSTNSVGVFSPVHANGAIRENHSEIYARMYNVAGEKWARAGAASHAICLYAHDNEALKQLFLYGFGVRCVDAIRIADDMVIDDSNGYYFTELKQDEFLRVLPLDHMLDKHMSESPVFILRRSADENEFLQTALDCSTRFFIAKYQGEAVAFVRVERGGETFICDSPGYIHINGAYCMPEHRGGMFKNLLAYACNAVKHNDITHIGVDFESINPSAHRFWTKHFNTYTYGLVRRVDEHSVNAMSKG